VGFVYKGALYHSVFLEVSGGNQEICISISQMNP
jgi:hypothetical protein